MKYDRHRKANAQHTPLCVESKKINLKNYRKEMIDTNSQKGEIDRERKHAGQRVQRLSQTGGIFQLDRISFGDLLHNITIVNNEVLYFLKLSKEQISNVLTIKKVYEVMDMLIKCI